MAIGPDRVQVLKQESAALGGDAADDAVYLTPIDPTEDAIESAGGYVQAPSEPRDETVGWERDQGRLRLFDQEIALTSLLELARAVYPAAQAVVSYASGDVSSVSIYTDNTLTVLLSTATVTYSGGDVATVTEREYAGGIEKSRYLTTLTYSSGDVSGFSRVKQL